MTKGTYKWKSLFELRLTVTGNQESIEVGRHGGKSWSRKLSFTSSNKHRKLREGHWRLARLAKLPKPAPSDVLPPAWQNLLNSPKTAPPTGDKNI